jgi:hypothetical protein
MAVLMIMTWPEATREIYEKMRTEVDWVGMRPNGANLHVSGFDEAGGLHVVDHWDSAEQFEAFVAAQVAPAAQKAGITTQPQVTIVPVAYVDQFDEIKA